jgi:hypothetical protein
LGTLGAYFGPLPSLIRPPEIQCPRAYPEIDSTANSNEDSVLQRRRLLGIVVNVQLVGSISVASLHDGVQDDQNYRAYSCFSLRAGEALMQIDFYRDTAKKIVGVCFHSEWRSSRWYGRCQGSFDCISPPVNHAFDSVYLSTEGFFKYTCAPLSQCIVVNTSTMDENKYLDYDGGLGNIRICSNTDVGLAFVVLSKFNKGDEVDDVVMEWPHRAQLPKTLWLSYDMLQKSIAEGENLSSYCLEAVDGHGTSVLARILPHVLTN